MRSLSIGEEDTKALQERKSIDTIKKQFRVAYEDENVIIVEKPFGLLVHGDKSEKKNTLANQVISYLIEKGEYVPRHEKTFVPSPVNRLDRNTTGLVIFGKNNRALQSLNEMIRDRWYIRKFYLTIVHGELNNNLHLKDRIEKDERINKVRVIPKDSNEGKIIETIAKQLKQKWIFSLKLN